MEPKFRANVSDFNARQRLKGLEISNGNNKGMNSVIMALNDHLSKDKSMCGVDSQISRPALGG
jgi:hypothetical protein